MSLAASAAISMLRSTDSSIVELTLLRENVSEADAITATDLAPAFTAARKPIMLGTRTGYGSRSARGARLDIISAAPAICGTRFAFTKAATSTAWTPECESISINSSRWSTLRVVASFCRPSRAPTS